MKVLRNKNGKKEAKASFFSWKLHQQKEKNFVMIREGEERRIYIMGYIEELRKVVGTRPLILVGSAIIILNDNQEVLLQYRSDTYDWGVPGGAMELGETTEETARRELFEETGLTAKIMQFLGVLSGKEVYFRYPNGDEIFNVIHLYQGHHVSGELRLDHEGLKLQYFPVDKLPKLNETTEKILQKFLYALTE